METISAGRGKQILQLPRRQWEDRLAQAPAHMKERLAFMSEEHRAVRYLVVGELPRLGKPIPPEFIAERLGLPVTKVTQILEDLESRLFFLVRDRSGNVTWAFPVTVEETQHQLIFNTGERLYAA